MRILLGLVVAGAALVGFDVVPAPYVFGPLVGYAIWRVGTASFASLGRGAAHVPDDDEGTPVDLRRERITYWCQGCGAEVLLLVRGVPLPPRHCGERMTERVEVARDRLE